MHQTGSDWDNLAGEVTPTSSESSRKLACFPSRVLRKKSHGSRREDSSPGRTGPWMRQPPWAGGVSSTPWARRSGRSDVTCDELRTHFNKVEMIALGLLLRLFASAFRRISNERRCKSMHRTRRCWCRSIGGARATRRRTNCWCSCLSCKVETVSVVAKVGVVHQQRCGEGRVKTFHGAHHSGKSRSVSACAVCYGPVHHGPQGVGRVDPVRSCHLGQHSGFPRGMTAKHHPG